MERILANLKVPQLARCELKSKQGIDAEALAMKQPRVLDCLVTDFPFEFCTLGWAPLPRSMGVVSSFMR